MKSEKQIDVVISQKDSAEIFIEISFEQRVIANRFISPIEEFSEKDETTIRELHSGNTNSVSEESLKSIGFKLFKSIFNTGEIENIYKTSIKRWTNNPHEGHQVQLYLTILGIPTLTSLPWEMMHDGNEWLVTRQNFVLIRRPTERLIDKLEGVNGQLKILFVGASPDGIGVAINLQELRREIEEQIDNTKGGRDKNRIEVSFLINATPEELQEGLSAAHLLFYYGHADSDYLYLDDGQGDKVDGHRLPSDASRLSAKSLANYLVDKPTRFVFLMGCNTGAEYKHKSTISNFASTIMENSNIAAVVVMQFPVNDYWASRLTTSIFRAIRYENGVDRVIAEAMKSIPIDTGNKSQARSFPYDIFAPVIYLQTKNADIFKTIPNRWKQAAVFSVLLLLVFGLIFVFSGRQLTSTVTKSKATIESQNTLMDKTNEQLGIEESQSESMLLAEQAIAMLTTSPWLSLSLALEAKKLAGQTDVTIPAVDHSLYRILSQVGGRRIGKVDESLLGFDLSLDNSLIAIVGENLKVWNLKSELSENNKIVISVPLKSPSGNVVISPNNLWVTVWDTSGNVSIWSTETGRLEANITLDSGSINDLVISPDGSWIASANTDQTLSLWDRANLDSGPYTFSSTWWSIETVVFSPDSQWLLSTNENGQGILWNIGYSKNLTNPLPLLLDNETRILKAGFTGDGRWVVTADQFGQVHIWDLSTDNPAIQSYLVFNTNSKITAFKADSYSGRIAFGTNDGKVWVFSELGENLTSPPVQLVGSTGSIFTLDFSADEQWIAAGSSNNSIALWNIRNAEDQASPLIFFGHEGAVTNIKITVDSRWLISSSNEDATLRLWDMSRPMAAPLRLGEFDHVRDPIYSNDAQWVSLTNRDKVRLWKLKDSDIVTEYDMGLESWAVSFAGFSRDSRLFYTASNGGLFRLWGLENIDSDAPIVNEKLEGDIEQVTIGSNGDLVIVVTGNMKTNFNSMVIGYPTPYMYVWDLSRMEVARAAFPITDKQIEDITVSPNSAWFAVSLAYENSIQFWKTDEVLEQTFTPYSFARLTEPATTINFGNDSKSLMVSTNHQALLFDLDKSPVNSWNSGRFHAEEIVIDMLPYTDFITSTTVHTSRDGTILVASIDVQPAYPQTPISSGTYILLKPDINNLAVELLDPTIDISDTVFSTNNDFVLLRTESTQATLISTSNPQKRVVLKGLNDSFRYFDTNYSNRWAAAYQIDWHEEATEKRSKILLWNLASSSPISPTVVIDGASHFLFSPLGKWLLVNNQLWNLETDHLNNLPTRIEMSTISMWESFSPDDKWLVLQDENTTTYLMPLDITDLSRIACNTMGRNLTYSEWAKYMPSRVYQPTCSIPSNDLFPSTFVVNKSSQPLALDSQKEAGHQGQRTRSEIDGRSVIPSTDITHFVKTMDLAELETLISQVEAGLTGFPEFERKVQALARVGHQLALDGYIEAADIAFRRAKLLDSALNLDPVEYARIIFAKSLIESAADLAKNEDWQNGIENLAVGMKILKSLLSDSKIDEYDTSLKIYGGIILNQLTSKENYPQPANLEAAIQETRVYFAAMGYQEDDYRSLLISANPLRKYLSDIDFYLDLNTVDIQPDAWKLVLVAFLSDATDSIDIPSLRVTPDRMIDAFRINVRDIIDLFEEFDFTQSDTIDNYMASLILRRGKKLARGNQIEMAATLYERIFLMQQRKDPENSLNPKTDSLIMASYDYAEELVRTGKIVEALATLKQVENMSTQFLNLGYYHNNICWYGALWKQAQMTIDYCDMAIRENENDAATYDSRGVARTFLGDYIGAITDFEVFVSLGGSQGISMSAIEERRNWITLLELGQNPFSDDLIELLFETGS